jgi:hypothetical protein
VTVPDSLRSSRLVAESLEILTELPSAADAPGVWSDHAPRYRAAPTVLRPEQVASWRRVMRALDGWRTAVLAEPVGSGKSWIALATAMARRGPVAVIAPALLRHQWTSAAARAGVRIVFTSVEQVSRGVLPTAASRLVVIDEAHRLRHGTTRRVAHLAPWLPGREVLMLTATPIVGSPRDLIALLRLTLADDALCLDGVASLADLVRCHHPPIALRRLVVRAGVSASPVTIHRHRIAVGRSEAARARAVVAGLDRLRLGETAAIARLIRLVLLDAATSSDRAWQGALRRYRGLLLHARDAGHLPRQEIRRFVGRFPDQTVMWQLLADPTTATALPVEDLETIDHLLAMPPRDAGWLADLTAATDDRVATLWFTRHLATAAWLRDQLGAGTAWITGQQAGVSALRLSREAVLAAFGPERRNWRLLQRLPQHLVLTDIGAEGLDLQGAGRVVHVDLPWHAVALHQRLGRIARSGQQRPYVTELIRVPAPAFARALGVEQLIDTKRVRAHRWLDALTGPPPTVSRATALGPRPSAPQRIAVIYCVGSREGLLRFTCVDGGWRLDPPGDRPDDRIAGHLVRGPLPGAVADLVRAASQPRAISRPRVVARLAHLARHAARTGQVDLIARLDTAWHAAIRAHPVGVERRLERLAAPDLVATLSRPHLTDSTTVTILAWYRLDEPAAPCD